MKIVCWQTVLTEHQIHTLRALETLADEPIEFVLGERELAERKRQGWTAVDLTGLSVHDLPDRGWWRLGVALLRRYPDALHLFNGMWGDRRFFPLLVFAQLTGVRTALMTEPFSDSRLSYFERKRSWTDTIKAVLRPLAYQIGGALVARRMEAVFAISTKAVTQFAGVGFKTDRIFPFGYFVPAVSGEHVADSLTERRTNLRLVFVGSLIERKGLPTLLNAIKVCHESGLAVSLDVYGPGNPPGSEAIPDGVEFRGVLPFGQTQLAVRDYDVLVLPSMHDGWGVVVNEALLQGVPVIVSDAVGARALVDTSGAGSVFEAGNVEALSTLIGELERAPLLLCQWQVAAAGFKPQLCPEVAANYLHECLLFASGATNTKHRAPWYP
jgi:glycosyltransferase involved in cell wall biosynthesis